MIMELLMAMLVQRERTNEGQQPRVPLLGPSHGFGEGS